MRNKACQHTVRDLAYAAFYSDADRRIKAGEKQGYCNPDTNVGQHLVRWSMLQAAKTLLDQHHGI